jgi:hypothetical protein
MKLAHFVLMKYIGILREEQKFRMFENGVLSRMYEHKREDVTGGSRKLYYEEFLN